jgi:thymidylate synthase ThyX
MIERAKKEMVIPTYWGKNQKGMQAEEQLDHGLRVEATRIWVAQAESAIKAAEDLASLGVHKQIANRVLEPFTTITVLVTGTKDAYSNFFALRNHKDAQPEIKGLAEAMLKSYTESHPHVLMVGDWHLPYVTVMDRECFQDLDYGHMLEMLLKLSAARCARVSYLTHNKSNPDIMQDLDLYAKLVGSSPGHFSPLEHQAEAMASAEYRSANFKGWKQYRQTMPTQYITNYFEDQK